MRITPLRIGRSAAALAGFAALALAQIASAAERSLAFQPDTTRVRFTLGATLHTAEGSVRLSSGELRFDPDAGSARGEIVLDAKSAETGSARRDANMHRDVLESAKYPTIVFRAESLDVSRRDASSADVVLRGTLSLHGQSRPFAIPAKLSAPDPRHIAVSSAFRVPYVDWGMVDYSTLVLRVDRFVDVAVEAVGTLGAP
ncbi:MAG TPA: YceI family protein [Myxococcota bacterium]|jgi:polyisoprenoid-binding protein YceI|nr:YceI family protein [Myxococcota bacterium]